MRLDHQSLLQQAGRFDDKAPMTLIGPYQLIRELGQGGMGVVYLAEQREPVHRQVALKLLHAGKMSQSLLSRFQLERDTLAMMNHPRIAVILDAGATDQGQPYFAMEYVPGQPITDFADGHKLDHETRLKLLLMACEGMQHAHRKTIIHRDLKPSNILVYEDQNQLHLKIIDFGLAKDLSDKGKLTADGQLVGTPHYMSPEQAAGLGVDVRTDVYALGLVLYELIVGQLPFESEEGSSFSYVMNVLKKDPPKPSERLSGLENTSPSIAANRGQPFQTLVRQCRGELDWVALRAIARDPDQRYETVADFARDIQSLLTQQPVMAGPVSRRYRLRKFFQRHKLAVLSSVGFVVALAMVSVWATTNMFRAQASQKRYKSELARNQLINQFLEDLLTSPDPRVDGRDVRMYEILEKQAASLKDSFQGQPDLRAQILVTMAKTFIALGDIDRADDMLMEALTLVVADSEQYVDACYHLSDVRLRQGRFDESADLSGSVAKYYASRFGMQDPRRLRAQTRHAHALYRGDKVAEAAELLRATAAMQLKQLGPDHEDTLYTQHQLANTLRRSDRLDEAEVLYRDVLARRTRVLGATHPDSIESLNNLANALFTANRIEEAEALYRQAYELRLAVLGEEHQQTLLSANNVGAAAYAQGNYQEAQRWYQATMDVQVKKLGPDHVDVAMSLNNLANVHRRSGNFDLSQKYYLDALRILEPLGHSHVEAVRTRLNYIKLLIGFDQLDEALRQSQVAIDLAPDIPDPWFYVAHIQQTRGQTQAWQATIEETLNRFPDQDELRMQLLRFLVETDQQPAAESQLNFLLERGIDAQDIFAVLPESITTPAANLIRQRLDMAH
ncbi:MAG: serine/threonine protein kinase [Acidobacteria bacterium]|nr:serine/threonine protein kinase [Acidobacteriota bacterium]